MSSAVETSSPVVAGVIDVELLLVPLSGENPAGEGVQYVGLYDEIREARRTEDSTLQGDWEREPKVADWFQVESLATEALATRTKDLQICAWLAEALVKLHGFPGLRDGLKLMCGLQEKFWDSVYPEIEEGDLEARANALSWMDRQLALAIKEVPITNSATAGPNYNYLQWEESKQFDIPENFDALDAEAQARATALRETATAEGKLTGEDWRKAKNTTRRAFYEEIYAALNECAGEFQALDRIMDQNFAQQTPGLSLLKKALDDVRSIIEKIVKEKRILEPDPVSAGQEETPGDALNGEQAAAGLGSTGPVRTRADALRRLGEVAAYFQQTEPHSPVSYLVERAIKWGQMPLEMWLQDVIKDGAVLGQLREILGLDGASDSGSYDSSNNSAGGYDSSG